MRAGPSGTAAGTTAEDTTGADTTGADTTGASEQNPGERPAGETTADNATADGATAAATRLFVDHRELLFSVVYDMLGSVADTEDVLQETWLSWRGRSQRAPLEEIGRPRAYLVRVAVNKALSRLDRVNRRRETYVGPWLPEPLVTDAAVPVPEGAEDAAERALRAESVSMALLVVLETLSPLERAVFVLNEVFGYPHGEIADILGRSPSAVRQLAHRAREHVHARRPRFRTPRHVQQKVTERFMAAALGGDVGTLMEILAPDVTVWTDSGGRTPPAALRPVRGRDRAARLLSTQASRRARGLDIRYQYVNGDPSAVVYADGGAFAVMVLALTPDSDQVSDVYMITNPEKLTHVREADGA